MSKRNSNRLSASGELNGISEKRLKEMWDNGEIHKCPRCRRYHVKTDISWVKTNMTLCESCQRAKDYYEKEWDQNNNEQQAK